ncbi:MAG: homocysteine S-methyltransferase family protein [Clostridia bacterium]|nr:homocysteine S-methyltransferase family protein [Clostridia bacterium]
MFDENKLVFLDGAMGTMLQRSGLERGEEPELIALMRPELLTDIHRQYVEAGSRIIYANTFGANRRKLSGKGVSVREVVAASVAAAKKAAGGTGCLVAVDIGPIDELLEPLGKLKFEDAVDIFREIAQAGEEAGADLAAIETMTDLQEARAALLAVKENTSLPAIVTMSFEERGRTFTGCTVAAMARTLEGLGADALGVNCSLGPVQLRPIVEEMCRNTRLPVIAKPNAGLPDPVDGHYDLKPEAFARAMTELIGLGVCMVGGCCGTDPDYIRALHDAAAGLEPGERVFDATGFVCTATTELRLDGGVHVIGERINPTGKKRFQQALKENDLDYIVDVAIQQADAGAELLDVNVGYPGVDEKSMLPRVVRALQEAVDLPLMLDSSDPEAIEAGLRVYCGKAAVNSVNGRQDSMDAILPVVRKYGASVVGLCLDEKGLPASACERMDIARRMLHAAESAGISAENLWIDCLTLTVSAQQDQAAETLRAVRAVRKELGLQTVLGVSNISFGLPNRPLITSAFLAAAISAGLTLPIVNPNQKEIMDTIAAGRALTGCDTGCSAYVERFAQAAPAARSADTPHAMSLGDAISRGLRAEAARLAHEELNSRSGMDVVESVLIPALDRVGTDYEQGKAFLPQLLSSAQAAQSVFEVIRTNLDAQGGEPVRKGKVIIATVEGDVHDIGKNIVRTVMENYGYEVLDLGRDVPPGTIVAEALKHQVRLVGLSALMTTTLPAMEETVRQLKMMNNPPQIMVGGAVVTEDYAAYLGAHYAKDARAAVEVARRTLG